MTQRTYNEELLDAMISHQVGILQFSGSVRNRAWALLDKTESDIKRQIADATNAGLTSPSRVRRLNKLLEGLRETRGQAWKDVEAFWIKEMKGLARAEVEFFERIIVGALPVELNTVVPDALRLRQIVTSKPFMGKTVRQWARHVGRADINRIEDQIKIGMVQGETNQQIARRVVGTAKLKGRDGVTQISRRQAAGITRTVTNGVAAESREEFLQANQDLAPQKIFVATLDQRTTPICRRFDGQIFAVDDPNAPVFPLHFGERSLYAPAIDGEVIGDRPRRDFTDRQLLREYADENGFRAPSNRDGLPRGHKGAFDAFARVRMRELTGTTAAKTTYGQWLGRQSAANQDDILGPNRGRLFRRGGLTVDKFVERDGTEVTLAQLGEQFPGAFEAAGLDPDDFQ